MARTASEQRRQVSAPPIPAFPEVQVYPKQDSAASTPEFAIDDFDSDSDADCLDLFETTGSFTVAQDLFLVQNSCFLPESPIEDVAVSFRREFGVERTPSDLNRRLQILQSQDLSALFAVYLKAIALDRDTNGSYGGSTTTVKPQYHSLLQRLRPTCETRLLQMIYEDEKSQSVYSETITIEVSSRNFPKYSRLVNKRQLAKCCKAIRTLFSDASHGADVVFSPHKGFSLHDIRNGVEKLQFTDSVPFYDSCMVFNHMEQAVVDRLLLFAKDPNVMERLNLQKQQLLEQREIKRELTHQLQAIFSTQRKLRKEQLEQTRIEQCEAITHRLERTLEQDIQHLRRMHESLLRHEHAKINARIDEQLSKLDRYISDMRSEVNALQQSFDASGWNTLDQDIARSSLQVERIFGTSDYILRLLILAEDLDADPLRRALVDYLSRENVLPQFALRREFTSKMISESTILAILKGVSTKDLREVESSGKNFAHHDLIVREIHTRRVIFSRFISSLTNDQLRIVSKIKNDGLQSVLGDLQCEYVDSNALTEMKAVVDFPDVLDHEFSRRREFSCVKMDTSGIDHEVSFSEDDCVLQLESSHRYCSVSATKERKQGESGKWMFEVTVEVFDGEGESILLGWEVPRRSRGSVSDGVDGNVADVDGCASSFVPGLTPSADGRSFGVTWQSDGGLEMGMLHANGQSRSGVACFRAGDVIGCTINQDELVPYLRFFLNGAQVIPSQTAPSATHTSASSGVACQNPVYCLFPVVAMYSSRRKPQMRVRFNFRGNFRFPLPGYEAYGADMI